jgi:hypothetical protein
MSTENQPHVAYCKATGHGKVHPTYADAQEHWQRCHSPQNPWFIATLGRVIDPSTPIIDVNE